MSHTPSIPCHGTRLIMACLSVMLIPACSTPMNLTPDVKALPRLEDNHYVSYDNDQFGYRKWLPPSGKAPSIVIVGVHGISGHSGDYENLATHLRKHHSDVALYAAETRGQGMDARVFRRGDIGSRRSWFKDLYTFTRLIRKKHPGSKIIWFGESMGSLIVMHAYSKTPHGETKPDAMVISSPIVDVESKLPAWKLLAVRLSALFLPKLRVSLETLSDGERPVVTKDDIHHQQAAKNPWYIPRYTLRLLLHLGDMAQSMDNQATQILCPVLVLHGGKDIFTREHSVNAFFDHLPDSANGIRKIKKFYPGSFHLLMYDHDREKIFKDISSWLERFSQRGKPNKP